MAADPEIVFDEENPEWTEGDFARARRGGEALPAEVLAAFATRRGRTPSRGARPGKTGRGRLN
jgi:hypothetical protein